MYSIYGMIFLQLMMVCLKESLLKVVFNLLLSPKLHLANALATI